MQRHNHLKVHTAVYAEENDSFVVENLGLDVPFIRPYELSKDESGTREVILHAINYYENKGLIFNTIILPPGIIFPFLTLK